MHATFILYTIYRAARGRKKRAVLSFCEAVPVVVVSFRAAAPWFCDIFRRVFSVVFRLVFVDNF